MTSLTLLVAKVPTAKSIPSNNTSYCGPIGGSGWQLAVDYCSPLTACPSGTPAECGNGWTCYSGIECSRSPEEVEENFDGDQYVAPSVDLQSETNSVPATAEVLGDEDGPVQVQSEPPATTELQSEQNGLPPVTNEETIYQSPVINAPGVSFGSEGDPPSPVVSQQDRPGETAPDGASTSPVGGDDCYCVHSADGAVQIARAYHTMIQDCSHLRKCVNGSCPSGQMAFFGINCDENNGNQLESSTSQTPDAVGSAESNESEAPASDDKLEASTSNNPSQVVGEPESGGPTSNGSVPSPSELSEEIFTSKVGSGVELAEVENTFFCGRCV